MTIPGLGTSWMHHPPANVDDTVLIADMTTMHEVRPYMCPKSHGDPNVCMNSCDGIRSCQAGQRAVAITIGRVKEQTVKASETRAAKATTPQQRGGQTRHAMAAERIRQVLKQPDPRQYLMDHEGLTYAQMIKWVDNKKQRYPEIFEECPIEPIGDWSKRREQKETPKAEPKAAEPEEDEISLEDFLSGFSVDESSEPEPEPPKPVVDDFAAVIEAKYKHLGEEIAQWQKIKTDAEERIKRCEEQRAALEITLGAFQNTAT